MKDSLTLAALSEGNDQWASFVSLAGSPLTLEAGVPMVYEKAEMDKQFHPHFSKATNLHSPH